MSKDTVASLRKRIAELEEPRLRSLHIENGAIEMSIEESTGLVHRMAAAMLAMLEGNKAKNYVQQEVSISTRDYVLLVQRRNGKTPHQLRTEAETQRNAAVAALRGLLRPDGTYCDHAAAPCHRCDAADAAIRLLESSP